MNIVEIQPNDDFTIHVITDDGRSGIFDVKPYLQYEAFQPLNQKNNFKKVTSFKYFIAWECGADLSANTIEAHLKPIIKRDRS